MAVIAITASTFGSVTAAVYASPPIEQSTLFTVPVGIVGNATTLPTPFI